MLRYDNQHDEQNSKIDLTPMLDVVFIMLIFFIVTASFVREVGLDIVEPTPTDKPPIQQNASILVQISARNGLIVDHRAIDVRRIRANLQRLRAENPGVPVVIDAHPKSNNNTMVLVMDASRAAGIHDIRFLGT